MERKSLKLASETRREGYKGRSPDAKVKFHVALEVLSRDKKATAGFLESPQPPPPAAYSKTCFNIANSRPSSCAAVFSTRPASQQVVPLAQLVRCAGRSANYRARLTFDVSSIMTSRRGRLASSRSRVSSLLVILWSLRRNIVGLYSSICFLFMLA